jgi:glycosyltransferase involved in cell wall biosynthesis
MIPEIIQHGENGLLGNTEEELRGHCEYLLNNPDEARRLGDNAKATIINEFNLDRFVKSWNKQFFNVIQNYRK